VASTYGDDYFCGGGAGYDDYLSQRNLLTARGQQFAEMVSRYTGKRGRVLDVGAAAGFLLSGWLAAGWSGLGVEPNQTMCQEGKAKGLDLRCGTFETADLDDVETIDCVSMVQVLSHFQSPRQAMERACSVLSPGGVLLIETWNRSSWIATISGKGWHEYSPPSVLHWFTPKCLDQLANTLGLEKVASKRSSRWINVGHAKSLLKHASQESKLYAVANQFARLLPDSLSLPYPGDDLFWALYRKAN
jgi:SAM-dependent methyltransferase